jgi:hypothetical protein
VTAARESFMASEFPLPIAFSQQYFYSNSKVASRSIGNALMMASKK